MDTVADLNKFIQLLRDNNFSINDIKSVLTTISNEKTVLQSPPKIIFNVLKNEERSNFFIRLMKEFMKTQSDKYTAEYVRVNSAKITDAVDQAFRANRNESSTSTIPIDHLELKKKYAAERLQLYKQLKTDPSPTIRKNIYAMTKKPEFIPIQDWFNKNNEESGELAKKNPSDSVNIYIEFWQGVLDELNNRRVEEPKSPSLSSKPIELPQFPVQNKQPTEIDKLNAEIARLQKELADKQTTIDDLTKQLKACEGKPAPECPETTEIKSPSGDNVALSEGMVYIYQETRALKTGGHSKRLVKLEGGKLSIQNEDKTWSDFNQKLYDDMYTGGEEKLDNAPVKVDPDKIIETLQRIAPKPEKPP
jgi:uncharacterized coiled-coil protein SlyX/DNA-binding transcriptional MerR regulator